MLNCPPATGRRGPPGGRRRARRGLRARPGVRPAADGGVRAGRGPAGDADDAAAEHQGGPPLPHPQAQARLEAR